MSDLYCEPPKMLSQAYRLPLELLIAIADQLCNEQDIVAFGLTCKDLNTLLLKKQRRSLEIEFFGSMSDFTAMERPKYRLLNQHAAKLKFSFLEESAYLVEDTEGALRLSTWWDITTAMAAANEMFSQDDCRLPKGIKDLTLSGYAPFVDFPGYSSDLQPFMWGRGFDAVRLETFKVELTWNNWDFRVMEKVHVTDLKVLKLPICQSSDCAALGRTLTNMPRLTSLTITEIPARDAFIYGLEHIGKGILSCASTLRELDIEMTNYNHLPAWARDERFIEPAGDGFFFRKLFPYASMEENVAPLRLTKLRVKHLKLPWYSFSMVFNATTIKQLHLPYSLVDDKVWKILETDAQLDTLTDVSYGMLSAEFLRFLRRQSLLKELTFVRPQDRYEQDTFRNWGPFGGDLTFRVSARAHRLGPDAGAKYPTLNDFCSCLKDMTILKHLVLPVDMYIITRRSLVSIAASLTGLEHLELGFDYEDLELQQVFISDILFGMPVLKKITFLSLRQPEPLPDFDSLHFHTLIVALGSEVPGNLKLLRYVLPREHGFPPVDTEVFYHRDTPVEGEWWIHLPAKEREQIFAEGRTPRIVPVGKWNWEIEAEGKI